MFLFLFVLVLRMHKDQHMEIDKDINYSAGILI